MEGEESGEYVFRLFLIYSNLSLSSLMQSAEVLHGACSGWEHDAFITSSPGGEVSFRVLKYFHAVGTGRSFVSILMGKSREFPPLE